MQANSKQPLTNVQLEILKVFSHQLSDNELLEFRKNLAMFFAQRLIQQADKIWTDKEWTDKEVDKMLNTKMRKKNK